jgi:hypothetical protein
MATRTSISRPRTSPVATRRRHRTRPPYHRDKYCDATFQLNGPIQKDKLWFFLSYQYQRDYQSPVGVPQEFRTGSTPTVFGKINWQISDRNKLMLAYHDDYYRIPCADTNCNA